MIPTGSNKIRLHIDERKVLSILVLIVLVFALLPLLIFGLTILFSPRFIMPFLYDLRGSTCLVVLCLWEMLGMWLFIRETEKGFHPRLFSKLVKTVIIFVFPFTAASLFGPTVLTIVDRSAFDRIDVAPYVHHQEAK